MPCALPVETAALFPEYSRSCGDSDATSLSDAEKIQFPGRSQAMVIALPAQITTLNSRIVNHEYP